MDNDLARDPPNLETEMVRLNGAETPPLRLLLGMDTLKPLAERRLR